MEIMVYTFLWVMQDLYHQPLGCVQGFGFGYRFGDCCLVAVYGSGLVCFVCLRGRLLDAAASNAFCLSRWTMKPETLTLDSHLENFKLVDLICSARSILKSLNFFGPGC